MIKFNKNRLILAVVTSFIFSGFTVNSFSEEVPSHHQMSAEAEVLLEKMISSDQRSQKHKARDKYRHPAQTLKFFGLEPHMTAVEIWPGGQGGWYREILEPFLADNGKYIPVRSKSAFPEHVDNVPYGEVDMVLIFRAHAFIMKKPPISDYVKTIYSMLKPGGIMAIVDHAGNENIPQSQDPEGKNGYINESHFRAIAIKEGFEFLAESNVNRNPKDTKNYPRGVWSLPPTLSGSYPFTDERAKYLAIGESDRFTVKFRKPE
ncbi:MAG: methyltransferase [Alphaproteobacteria bacterium]|nr:MAG: methyltransferase [Alphaproteobacteria bacterium]